MKQDRSAGHLSRSARARAQPPPPAAAALALLALLAGGVLVGRAGALVGTSAYCTLVSSEGTALATYKAVYYSCLDRKSGVNCRRKCKKVAGCAMYHLTPASCDPDNCCVTGADGCKAVAPLTGKPDPLLPLGTLMCDIKGQIRATARQSGGNQLPDLTGLEAEVQALKDDVAAAGAAADKAALDAAAALMRVGNETLTINNLFVGQDALNTSAAQARDLALQASLDASLSLEKAGALADGLAAAQDLAGRSYNASQGSALQLAAFAALVQNTTGLQGFTDARLAALEANLTTSRALSGQAQLDASQSLVLSRAALSQSNASLLLSNEAREGVRALAAGAGALAAAQENCSDGLAVAQEGIATLSGLVSQAHNDSSSALQLAAQALDAASASLGVVDGTQAALRALERGLNMTQAVASQAVNGSAAAAAAASAALVISNGVETAMAEIQSNLTGVLAAANQALSAAGAAGAAAAAATSDAGSAVSSANSATAAAGTALAKATAVEVQVAGFGSNLTVIGNESSVALATANSALTTANTANTNANTAVSMANAASNAANAINNTASTALTTANSALTTANTASTNANNALTAANAAASNASTALGTANTASTTANTALAKATAVEAQLNTINVTAESALSFAAAAQENASAALADANTALAKATQVEASLATLAARFGALLNTLATANAPTVYKASFIARVGNSAPCITGGSPQPIALTDGPARPDATASCYTTDLGTALLRASFLNYIQTLTFQIACPTNTTVSSCQCGIDPEPSPQVSRSVREDVYGILNEGSAPKSALSAVSYCSCEIKNTWPVADLTLPALRTALQPYMLVGCVPSAASAYASI